MKNLEEEVNRHSNEIYTTEMKMSIGEIINLYKDEEIIIRPEFQRLFRWSIEQKSKFIESILIGIPIPPIFVQQREDGVWEIVDGLQRVSTILEFVGVLKDREPKPLVKTKFLPSLDGVFFKEFDGISESKENHFSKEMQLAFKRVPLGVEIIKRESDPATKYELFDRLNSGGSLVTEQEIRNAIFLVEKPFAIKLLHKLANQDNFNNSVVLSDRDISSAYNEEIVLRFLAYTQVSHKFCEYGNSIKDFLDNYLKSDIAEKNIDFLEKKFNNFFDFMESNFAENSFRVRMENGKYIKGFKLSKFEALVIGLKDCFEKLNESKEFYIKKIEELEQQDWYKKAIEEESQVNRIGIFLDKATKYFKLG
jgi:hypothetical protein